MHSARPTMTFCLLPHSTLTVLPNEYKPICLHHCQILSVSVVTSSLLQLSVDHKLSVPYNNCPFVYVLTNASDNFSLLLILTNARHTLQNSLASLFRLQQKSTIRIQNCPHSTSTLPLVQLHSELNTRTPAAVN